MIYLISNHKMPFLPKKTLNRGQVLLSIIIAIVIFSILAHALFTLIASSFELVAFNKARTTARYLAQEKMELIRNLPYNEVATIGGIPSGTLIPQTETVNKNGLNYTIKTDIVYIDDPYDGLAPEDLAPEDYKRVRVEVSWEGLAASRKNPIVLISDVSALASSSLDGGTLVILVFDANGNPVPQAEVKIVADSITPAVNLIQATNTEGQLILPGAAECIECYEITVTKNTAGVSMSTDRTYSSSEVTNPLKPHASIFLKQVTQLSFTIDELGSLNIMSLDSREENFAPLGNVSFRLRGSKTIGTDAYAQPVYKYDKILTTNDSGNISVSDIEWDVYQISMPEISTKNISGNIPLLPLVLSPGGNMDFKFSTASYSDHSFLLTVKDGSQNLIASASARLYDGLGFENAKTTGVEDDPDYGQVFFANLEEKTYQLEATASGFVNFLGEFSISGYTKTDIILTPE
jgi:hypothetical protein